MATTQDKIAGLYAAFFNRSPDKSGFDWWTEQITSGQSSFEDISTGFAQHPVFTATYGGMSNEEFVNAIYTNMLGTAADAGGLAYYTGKLTTEAGYARSDMVAEFIGGVLDVDLTNPAFDSLTPQERAAAEQRQALMQNKVQVSQSFIEQLAEQTNITNYENLDLDSAYLASQKILTNITYDTTTVTDAIDAITQLSTLEGAISVINSIENFSLENVVEYINSNYTLPIAQNTMGSGVFLDNYVSNLAYTSVSLDGTEQYNGITDSNGGCQYFHGGTTEFFIGSISIGKGNSGEFITVGDITTGNQEETNVARLLQTLDSNHDLTDGINIWSGDTAMLSDVSHIW
jgi:hypothetical protein